MKPEKISLSPRELQIMERVAQGETDYSISRSLTPPISPHTVDKYIRNILRKCGVNSRSAALAVCLLKSENKRQLSLALS